MAADFEQSDQPSIHDPAYWEADLEAWGEQWEQVNVEMTRRTPEQQAEWDVFLYDTIRHLHGIIQQLALERPEPPKRKRTR